TILLPRWGPSVFRRQRERRYLTPIVQSQQDSIFLQSPSLLVPCQPRVSGRRREEVRLGYAVEPQPIWPAIVASSGGVPELAFVSEVPSPRTLVDHSREKFRPGLHKASFWNEVLLRNRSFVVVDSSRDNRPRVQVLIVNSVGFLGFVESFFGKVSPWKPSYQQYGVAMLNQSRNDLVHTFGKPRCVNAKTCSDILATKFPIHPCLVCWRGGPGGRTVFSLLGWLCYGGNRAVF